MVNEVNRGELLAHCDAILNTQDYKDYAPNGLQVEGVASIRKIVTGVTASLALIEAAVAEKADMIMVHHGYFWGNEDQRIIGMKQKRIKALLSNNINLVGYHLPLDAHAELGNNAQLAQQLKLKLEGRSGKFDLVNYGALEAPMTVSSLSAFIEAQLGRKPLIVGPAQKSIQRMAWCTGAAQNYIHEAINLGVDAFISGEISEQTTHIAEENEIVYIAAGHHATERYGIQALGKHLEAQFGVVHKFIDVNNPV